MGKLFSDFDEAWAAFLEREEPLESLYERLPEDESATLDVWLVQPAAAAKAAVPRIQQAFAHLSWIEPVPGHFLHVTIGHGGNGSFDAVQPFEISFRRVACSNEAVVVEVQGDGPRRLAECLGGVGFFLPHVSIGYVRVPGSADEVRRALAPVRDADLGTQLVDEVLLCRVPASRTTLLRPWTVVERVPLRR